MSSNLIYLQAERMKKACMMELHAKQYSRFTCVEEMNASIDRFLNDWVGQLSDTALILLAVLAQHSCVVPGVSWLTVRSMAALVGVTDRTVQIALKTLESAGIILRIPTAAKNGAQRANYVTFQVYEAETNPDHEEAVAIQELLVARRQTAAAQDTFAEDFTGGNGGDFAQISLSSLNSTKTSKHVCMSARDRAPYSSHDILNAIKTFGNNVILNPGNIESFCGNKNYVLSKDEQTVLEIAATLPKKFKNQVDPAVIEIACETFMRKVEQACWKHNDFKIENPVGWFMFSYGEAIKLYKLMQKPAI